MSRSKFVSESERKRARESVCICFSKMRYESRGGRIEISLVYTRITITRERGSEIEGGGGKKKK